MYIKLLDMYRNLILYFHQFLVVLVRLTTSSPTDLFRKKFDASSLDDVFGIPLEVAPFIEWPFIDAL